ncbi:hypothetical protein F5Y11DRAFT_244880 [Daldinia sp. FL1419]|nr:hypothetical protein F5Y11DRAFT_244880 [Daldinia sp. FL1419]
MAMSAPMSFKKTTLSHAQKSVLAMSRAQYLDDIRATRPADKLYVGVCIFRMDAHSSRPSVLLLRRSANAATPETASSSASSLANTPNSPSAASTSTSTTTTFGSSRWGRRHVQYRAYSGASSGGEGGRERDGDPGHRTRRNAGTWELPGGKVRESDYCISAAVARCVAEQTGLHVDRFLGALQDVRRVAEVRILDWDDDGMGIFTAGGSSSGNLSVLDGATLTSATGSPGSGSLGGSSANGYSYSGSSSSWSGGAGGIGGRGGIRGSTGSSQSRRSPIHNPQLVLRKECLQLNYAVLVRNHEDLSVKSLEHDEMVWASFSRAEALPMPEELRTVVHQGLAFAGEYLF